MARNRKYRTAASRFGPALKAFLLCLLIGGSGVGYVWQKDQIRRLSQQFKDRENRLKQLEDENEKRRQELARMRSPASLEAQIKKWNLGLVQPQLSQVLRLNEPSRETLPPFRSPQYALGETVPPKPR
jgi:uncharacterized protein HemX